MKMTSLWEATKSRLHKARIRVFCSFRVMVVEVELMNGQFFGEGRLAPSQMDGVVPAVLSSRLRGA